MSRKTYRLLFVFNSKQNSATEIQAQISSCEKTIARFKKYNHVDLELHILYALPEIPSFALQTPEISKHIQNQEKHASNLMQLIGLRLDVPNTNLHLRRGLTNVVAAQLASEYATNVVVGYTTPWISFTRKWQQIKKQMRHFPQNPIWSNEVWQKSEISYHTGNGVIKS